MGAAKECGKDENRSCGGGPPMGVKRPEYGNWVSSRLLIIPAGICIVLAALSFLVPVLAIPALLFFAVFVYLAYARYQFSPRGGNLQERIQNLILEYLQWEGEGKAIDIGCGDASLTIKLATRYPHAAITGIDSWGPSWKYSLDTCRRNVEFAGLSNQIKFEKASAARIPFQDESYDLAVSNLTFHEVREARDKRKVLKEALRVVKKGGTFIFQDLFLWKAIYGDIKDLISTVKNWGIEEVEFIPTNNLEFIPKGLKLPFMVGTMGVLHGRK
jgi:SAM-dependent methyltransferase